MSIIITLYLNSDHIKRLETPRSGEKLKFILGGDHNVNSFYIDLRNTFLYIQI